MARGTIQRIAQRAVGSLPPECRSRPLRRSVTTFDFHHVHNKNIQFTFDERAPLSVARCDFFLYFFISYCALLLVIEISNNTSERRHAECDFCHFSERINKFSIAFVLNRHCSLIRSIIFDSIAACFIKRSCARCLLDFSGFKTPKRYEQCALGLEAVLGPLLSASFARGDKIRDTIAGMVGRVFMKTGAI